MDLIAHLMRLTKHQNTAISFVAYCILKFIQAGLQAINQQLDALSEMLFSKPDLVRAH
jgi:hypothetical protein